MLTVSTNPDQRTTMRAATVQLRNPRTVGRCAYHPTADARLFPCGWRCPACAPRPPAAVA